MTYPSFLIEELYWENNQSVIGIDEAGRGCLAGPVFAAAVIFPKYFDLDKNVEEYFRNLITRISNACPDGFIQNEIIKKYNKIISNPKCLINDSKLLEPHMREIAYDFIVEKAYAFSISSTDSKKIDEINILQATQSAFRGTLEKLKLSNEHILIDGNYFKKYKNLSFETVVKGDSKSLSIAAASILAKVSRDSYVKTVMHKKYPDYGFENHVGYATKKHFKAIEKYGITEFHRETFLKKFQDRKKEF